MSQTLLLLLAAFAIVLFLGYLSRTRRRDNAGRVPGLADAGHANGRYAAVSVHTFRGGCPAAEEIRGRRFLVDEAPMLPLADCSRSKCNCRYAHHSDRRSGTRDRRHAAPAAAWPGRERREQTGRRASDWSAAHSAAGAGQA